MKKVTVKVTKKDIKAGKKEDGASCPIAKAFRRQTKTHKKITVDYGYINCGGNLYTLPQEANDFIEYFDEGGAVKPFKFVAIQDTDRSF